MRSKPRRESERIQLINECQHSGMAVKDWCQQKGIIPNTYYRWISRLQKKGSIEKEATIAQPIVKPYMPEIVKVMVEKPAGIADTLYQTEPASSSGYQPLSSVFSGAVMEITCGIFSIKVSSQVNPHLLEETIRLIGGYMGC